MAKKAFKKKRISVFEQSKVWISRNMKRIAQITLISFVLVILTVSAFALTHVMIKARINDLISQTEDFVKNRELERAAGSIRKIVQLDSHNEKAMALGAEVMKGFALLAEKELATLEWDKAIGLFKKAGALDPSGCYNKRADELERSLCVPKLFIYGKPFNALVQLNGEPWDYSFPHMPGASDARQTFLFAPGNALSLGIKVREMISSLRISILSDKGTAISSNKGFVSGTGKGFVTWTCLIGIPSTLGEGQYVVAGSWFAADGKACSFRENIYLGKRFFPKETIVLSPSLTSLVSVPDKRKAEERRTVADILGSFHPDAVYEEDCLSIPAERCRAVISSAFGERRIFTYSSGGGYTSVHDGYDYGLPAGTPVFAAGRGKVALARKHIVSGNTIIIEHLPSVYSTYYHLSKILVAEGDIVSHGQKIAEVGSTGLSTAAHLHFSLFVGSVPVDPEFFITTKALY
jgi:hypothetical protein